MYSKFDLVTWRIKFIAYHREENSTLLDEEKVAQESEILEGTHDMKFNFNECSTDQPTTVLKDTKLDGVDKIATIVLFATKDKPASVTTLMSHIDL